MSAPDTRTTQHTPIYQLPYPQETDTADVPRDIQALAQRIEAVLPNVGMVPGMGADWYSANAPPSGFLLCDGSAVSRTTYSALFAAIGTSWGGGDGVNTFSLPDTRARVMLGTGGAAVFASSDGQAVGVRKLQHAHTVGLTASHSLSLPQHAHAISDPGHAHYINTYESGPANDPRITASSNGGGDGRTGYFSGAIQATGTGVSVGGITSAPAINGGVTIGGSVGAGGNGTIDTPSFVVATKVIRT